MPTTPAPVLGDDELRQIDDERRYALEAGYTSAEYARRSAPLLHVSLPSLLASHRALSARLAERPAGELAQRLREMRALLDAAPVRYSATAADVCERAADALDAQAAERDLYKSLFEATSLPVQTLAMQSDTARSKAERAEAEAYALRQRLEEAERLLAFATDQHASTTTILQRRAEEAERERDALRGAEPSEEMVEAVASLYAERLDSEIGPMETAYDACQLVLEKTAALTSPHAPPADTLAVELAGVINAHANYWRHAVWPRDFTPLRKQLLSALDRARAAGLLDAAPAEAPGEAR